MEHRCHNCGLLEDHIEDYIENHVGNCELWKCKYCFFETPVMASIISYQNGKCYYESDKF